MIPAHRIRPLADVPARRARLRAHAAQRRAVSGAQVFSDVVAAYSRANDRPVALLRTAPTCRSSSRPARWPAKADIAIVNLRGRTLSPGPASVPPSRCRICSTSGACATRSSPGARGMDGCEATCAPSRSTRTNWPVSASNAGLLDEASVRHPDDLGRSITVADALRSKGISPVTVGDSTGRPEDVPADPAGLPHPAAKKAFSSGKLSDFPGAVAGVGEALRRAARRGRVRR